MIYYSPANSLLKSENPKELINNLFNQRQPKREVPEVKVKEKEKEKLAINVRWMTNWNTEVLLSLSFINFWKEIS